MAVLLLLFQFGCLLFFLVWFLWLVLLIIYSIEVVKVGILVLFLILEKKLQLFTVKYDVSYEFLLYGLNYVEICSLYQRRWWQPTPVFLPGESQGQWSLVGCRLWGSTELDTTEVIKSFYHEWMLNFVRWFFCIYWNDSIICILPFVNVVYHIWLICRY